METNKLQFSQNVNFGKKTEVKKTETNTEQKVDKNGKKKLALALTAMATVGAAGIIVAAKKGKFYGVQSELKDLSSSVKLLTKARKNPEYIKTTEMIKKYEKLLKKPGISEKTITQINNRLNKLTAKQQAIYDSIELGGNYLSKVKEKKCAGLANTILDNVLILPNKTKPYWNCSKMESFIKELERHTGKKYTPEQFDDLVSILKLNNKIKLNQLDIKSGTYNLLPYGVEETLEGKITKSDLSKIRKIYNKSKSKWNKVSAKKELAENIESLKRLTGKDFKNLIEVNKFIEEFSHTLQF